jgi:hypothetical protein
MADWRGLSLALASPISVLYLLKVWMSFRVARQLRHENQSLIAAGLLVRPSKRRQLQDSVRIWGAILLIAAGCVGLGILVN